jgi:glycosyltransferase involved in cell wall biosynthesis
MSADAIGGVWTYAIELARALGRFGIEVAMATMGAPLTSEQREEAERLPNLTVFESDYKLEWMHEPWEDVRLAGEWLLDLEQFWRPDVIHLNGYTHGLLPWQAPVLVVGHSCVLSWWLSVRGEYAPKGWESYRTKVSRGLHAADMVVAPTMAMLLALNRHYGNLHCCRVIPNGRTAAFFSVAGKEPFILSAGRIWDEAKNMRMVQSIAAHLEWPVCIAGEDNHPDGGKTECCNVRLLGRLPPSELSRWFSRASIYALPAFYEPFGLTVLEAALSGCALVLGDIPSLREIWDGAAVFVCPSDDRSLRKAIEQIMEDSVYWESLVVCARQRAMEYTPERMAYGYIRAYNELMKCG